MRTVRHLCAFRFSLRIRCCIVYDRRWSSMNSCCSTKAPTFGSEFEFNCCRSRCSVALLLQPLQRSRRRRSCCSSWLRRPSARRIRSQRARRPPPAASLAPHQRPLQTLQQLQLQLLLLPQRRPLQRTRQPRPRRRRSSGSSWRTRRR